MIHFIKNKIEFYYIYCRLMENNKLQIIIFKWYSRNNPLIYKWCGDENKIYKKQKNNLARWGDYDLIIVTC